MELPRNTVLVIDEAVRDLAALALRRLLSGEEHAAVGELDQRLVEHHFVLSAGGGRELDRYVGYDLLGHVEPVLRAETRDPWRDRLPDLLFGTRPQLPGDIAGVVSCRDRDEIALPVVGYARVESGTLLQGASSVQERELTMEILQAVRHRRAREDLAAGEVPEVTA